MATGKKSNQEDLDYTLQYNPPMDLAVAERNLKEAKQILNDMGIVFLLGSGICLGATRDGAFIPWDDDVDLVSVIGINNSTEDSADIVAKAFRKKGYFVGGLDGNYSKTRMTVKENVRLSIEFLRITDDQIHAYPGIWFPSNMFTDPKEIDFLGEKFLVPNPPEQYLELKYGENWKIPRKAGEYEKDVVEKIEEVKVDGSPCVIRVLSRNGGAVNDAEIILVGGGRSRTDMEGYAEVILPGPDWYALMIRYPGHEQVLYMESLEPGRRYVYRSDSASKMAENHSGEVGTLGNLLSQE